MSNPTGPLSTEALDLFVDAVAEIATESWDKPTNLDGWSVRDLVAHATGTATKMVGLIEGGEVHSGPSDPADWVCDDPAGRLGELAARLREALPEADWDAVRPSPIGDAPLHRVLGFQISDLAIHSWDLYRSQGRAFELPDGLLAFCRALVDAVPEAALRRPGGFGPAQPAPADATPTTQLMAFLGRAVEG